MSLLDSIVNSVIGTGEIGLGLASLIMQRNANFRQESMQRDLFHEAQEWSSPVNQMNQRRLAGLNPYADFSSGSVGVPSVPNVAQGIPEIMNGMQGSLSRSAERVMQSLSQDIAKKALILQEKSLDKDIKFTDAQIALLNSQTFYQDIANEIAESTKGTKIELSKQEVQKLMNDILLQNINIENLPKQFAAQIENLVADTSLKNSQSGLNTYQKEVYLPRQLQLASSLNKAQVDKLVKELDLVSAETNKVKTEAGNLEISKAGMKEFKKSIDEMPEGFSKSFLKAIYLLLNSNLSFK